MPWRLPVTCDDHRARACRRLPRFLFDYVDGGAGEERTLAANRQAWAAIGLRQRVLVDVEDVDTGTRLAGQPCGLPLALAPLGLAGMLAPRGECLAARAARAAGVPFTLSTVGICSIEEVAAAAGEAGWFQLYWLRDRGILAELLERAWQAGCRTLVFTVDLPLPGMRHRDARNGMGVPGAAARMLRRVQLLARPRWLWRVGIGGRPLVLGSLAAHVPGARDLDGFRAFIERQFDPRVSFADLDWLRLRWRGRLLVKGVLEAGDARDAVAAGADGVIVSNHGGRQLDGAAATACKLPAVVEAVGSRAEVLVDGGLRSGVDLFRALALGARGALVGRPWAYALAAGGQQGVERLLALWREELRTTMALAGVTRVEAVCARHLDACAARARDA